MIGADDVEQLLHVVGPKGVSVPDPIPGLEPLRQRGAGAPTDRGLKPPEQGIKASSVTDVGGLILPAAVGLGAIPAGPESGIAGKAVHIISGLKPPPLGGEAIPTGFVGTFFLPQPIGMLPERFFQGKPRIPGTGVYLDPLHNLKVQTDRIGDDRRLAARVAQRRGLEVLVEDLTEDELRRLFINRNGERSAISFIDPSRADEIILTELRLKTAERKDRENAAIFAAERAAGLSPAPPGRPVLLVLAAGAAPAAAIPVRVSPLDSAGRPTPAFVRSLSPLGGPVAMASIQPTAIHPVNAAALANEAAAEGVRHDLVHERADP